MLSGMRKASENVVGRIILTAVMTLLIVSFGIFGIGSWLSGAGVGALATVGSTQISVETFRTTFQTSLQQLQQQARRNITTEEARLAGLDRQLLQQLVNEAALDEEARRLGLAMTNDIVVKAIATNPAFKGVNGQFDRTRFQRFASESQLSEAGLIEKQKGIMLQQQLIEGLFGAVATPKVLADAVNRQITEERTIAYVVVPPTVVPRFAPPDDKTLADFYQGHKAQFAAPEFRKVAIVALNPEDVGGDVEVSEEDLRHAYDDEVAAGRLGRVEKRSYEQIVYSSPEEANEAAARLKDGASFADLLAAKQLKAADVTFTDKTRTEIVDPVIAAAVFSLPKGEPSGPLQGDFGTTVLEVTDIVPGNVLSFEAAKPRLEATARQRKLQGDPAIQQKIDTLHDQVEDQRASGKSLAEIAADLKLKLINIDAVDQAGKDKAGKPIAVPDAPELLRAIFISGVGADTEAVRTPHNGYVWYTVEAVEPPREKPLDEVKGEVVTAWIAAETASKLAGITTENLKKLQGGASLEEIATAIGSTVETASQITRAGGSPQSASLGTNLVTEAFATPVNGYGEARAAVGANRVLFKVTDAHVPVLDPAGARMNELKTKLSAAMTDDLASSYVRSVESRLGVTIDARLLALALGS